MCDVKGGRQLTEVAFRSFWGSQDTGIPTLTSLFRPGLHFKTTVATCSDISAKKFCLAAIYYPILKTSVAILFSYTKKCCNFVFLYFFFNVNPRIINFNPKLVSKNLSTLAFLASTGSERYFTNYA